MSFKNVIGHNRQIDLLQRAIINDRVYHSYLFLGNEGTGRRYVALQFAKVLNCLERKGDEADACDQCLSCKKIDAGLHPDVLFLEPEGPSQLILKPAIMQLQRELAFRPFEGKHRVCILTTADRMAPEMSNTLLKTLEEPPHHTVIILLANSAKAILPTILSRCQQIRFNPLPFLSLTQWLTEKNGLSVEEAHLLAALSEGSPGKALTLREEIRQIPREEILKAWLGARPSSFGEIERWIESLPSNWEDLILILEVAKTLLRDLVIFKILGDQAKVIHSDLVHEMEALSSQRSLSSLLTQLESIHQTRLTLNPKPRIVNTTLALEAMMLSWAEG
ncbi:MAG TPA: DNA polymerase III subunit delta' [Thermodesulfobacteriota bacterium]|nr:DNA polymerase III subunit delta' [Thermodesulfobacteriota bacterium]